MSATTKFESTFAVPKMDCPSEENMIKMALQGVEGVQSLTFDLPGRKLVAVHRAPVAEVLQRLEPLGLGAKLVHSAAVDDSAAGSFKSTFHVPKMDCPSEENMIKLALQDVPGVKSLSFDLANRKLTAVHGAPVAQVLQRLEPLGLGAKLLESDAVMGDDDERAGVLPQRLLHRLPARDVQIVRGLIEDEQVLVLGEQDRQGQARPFPAREGGYRPFDVLAGQEQPREDGPSLGGLLSQCLPHLLLGRQLRL